MIILTGGAGFIGSCLLGALNRLGKTDIIVVDNLGTSEKWKNLQHKVFTDYIDKRDFLPLLQTGKFPAANIEAIFHLGACSSTTEQDVSYLMENNYRYSKVLAEFAIPNKIQFLYASSAATYGAGENGYSDEKIFGLHPLNAYGYSKQIFDEWICRSGYLNQVVGLKFFNVYGPNEYHKSDMRSLIHKSIAQIKKDKCIRLFKSYLPEYGHGEQKRDFIYVEDVIDLVLKFYQRKEVRGIFNIGCGQTITWNELAHSVFRALEMKPVIDYIEMPEELKSKYQYFTQADMSRVKTLGFDYSPPPQTQRIEQYVRDFILPNRYL